MPANKVPQRLAFRRKRATSSALNICCSTAPIRISRTIVDALRLSWRPSRTGITCCVYWRSSQRVSLICFYPQNYYTLIRLCFRRHKLRVQVRWSSNGSRSKVARQVHASRSITQSESAGSKRKRSQYEQSIKCHQFNTKQQQLLREYDALGHEQSAQTQKRHFQPVDGQQ